MSPSLTRFTYELVYNLLPVQSSNSSYYEVESDPFFENCRLLLFNTSTSCGIDSIVEDTLRLIEIITKQQKVELLSENALNSMAVILRLFSDIAETCWKNEEKRRGVRLQEDVDEQETIAKNTLGFSTQKLCFHTVRPKPIDASLAVKLIKIANRLKFNSNIREALRNISVSLYGSHASSNPIGVSEGQRALCDRYPKLVEIIDLNFDYILRFVSASNPNEYFEFLNASVIAPLVVTHTSPEGDVVHHLDLFSCFFITTRSLSRYLQVVSKVLENLKKNAYQELMLMFSSQALMVWVLSRPAEYVTLMSQAKSSPKNEDVVGICKQASSLFDDIYSSFNVSALLTMTTTSNSAISEHKNVSSSSSTTVSTSSSAITTGSNIETVEAKEPPTSSVGKEEGYFFLGSKFFSSSTITGISFEAEDLAHLSVLRFLSVILLLQPENFEEVNDMSFKYITDEQLEEGSGEKSSDDDKLMKSQSISSSKIRAPAHHRTLQSLKKLSSFSSGNKKTKFLSTLLRNINGSQIVSDVSLLNTLRTSVIILRLASSINLTENNSPVVLFAKRLLFVVSDSLQLCEESKAKKNPVIARCLYRNPTSHLRLQVAIFPPALIMEPQRFVTRLSQFTQVKHNDYKYLRILSEGFKLFFGIPNVPVNVLCVVLQTTDFLKPTLHNMSDVILKASPYFSANVSEIVDDILSGKICDDSDVSKVGRPLSPSLSPIAINSLVARNSPVKSSIPQSPSSSSVSSNASSHGERASTSTNRTDIVAPRARRPSSSSVVISSKTTSKPSSPSETEKHQPSVRYQLENLHRSVRSPLRLGRSRQPSDESLPPFQPHPLAETSTLSTISSSLPNNIEKTDLEDARAVLINIISVYKRMINYFFVSYDANGRVKFSGNYKHIIKPLFVGLIDDHPIVQEATRSFSNIMASYSIALESGDLTKDIQQGIYRGAAYLVTLVSMTLFNLTLDDKKREELLEVVARYLEVRSELLTLFEESGSLDSIREIEKSTHVLLQGATGRALFSSLYSHEPRIHKLLRLCFKNYLRELENHDKIIGKLDEPGSSNKEFLKAMCRDNYVSTGAVAFQRRLRTDILKYMEHPDRILFDTLDLVYNRWITLSRKTTLSSSEASHFRNFAGIIASCCGVFLTTRSDVLQEFSYFNELRGRVMDYIDYFIMKQCCWLNNANLLTRENSKDILSIELHPLGFKLLFKNLKKRTDELEQLDLTDPKNDTAFLLLEQIILILRTLLERDDAKEELILVSLELLDLIEQLFKIVENISHKSTKYYKAVIHMSKMVRSFEHAEKSICVSGYLLIKSRWLRLVISWFKATIFKEYDFENLGRSHREMNLKRRDIDYLYIDTSIESSKALAYITKDLMLEVPQSISESELKRSKAVIFGNYFSILLKGLEKSSSLENFPPTLRHKVGVLNENIITSLTNVLNANVDVGLRYALPIGYSKNRNIKVAFLKVFVNIISNYDIHKTKSLEMKNDIIEKYVNEILKHPQLVPLTAHVCPANDIDALAGSLLTVFDVKNCSHIIVVELIKDEIQKASRYSDVLRRNSCATRALSMISRLKGTNNLVKILKPVLDEIIENNDCFEVEKLPADHPDAAKNLQLFTKYLNLLIDSIVGAVGDLAPEFYILCQTIYTCVEEKFPDYGKTAVGSFIFLRYFCPAIVSPDAENIVDPLNSRQKRTFVILAKMVQNIANGSIGSIKWPLLQDKQSFLSECNKKISDYLLALAQIDRPVKIKLCMEKKVTINEFNFMHKFIYQHGLEMRGLLIVGVETTSEYLIMKNVAKVTDQLLHILGQPRMEFRNEIPPYIREKMDEYPELYDFMSRYSLRTLDFNDDIPYIREAVSPEGFPVIVFTYKMLEKQECDPEALTYRTVQVYSKIWATKHYFVVDCTGFNAPGFQVKKLFTFFMNLIPSEAAQNCVGMYYFNMSEKYCEWWLPLFKGYNPYLSPFKTPHHFFNSDASPDVVKNLKLSNYSNEVYSDVRVTLHDVSLYDPKKGRFTPVTLKIGNKYIQMISDTPIRFKVQGVDDVIEIKFNNVYEIANLDSTVVSSETGVPSEFTINFIDNTKMIFCSSKYLEIIKIFYYAQARIEEEYDNDNFNDTERIQNALSDEHEVKEIFGDILLVIFAGFCSDDDDVKNISYNLLAATQESFNLDFGCKLRVSPEVHVPHDTSAFCYSLLKGLARTAPELSFIVWKSILTGLSGVLDDPYIPHVISTLTPWVPNLYKYVYLANDEQGPENVSYIIRTLIKLSIADERLTMIYNQCIWSALILEADLVDVIVDEIVNHSLDRESEGVDWKNVISLLTRVATVEVCSKVINRIMRITKSFLPSLKLEASTNSWSELIILFTIAVSLFFDSLLLAEMYLPEVLYIVSLLIDVGPSELRLELHKLLMNVCQSLSTNESISASNRAKIDEVSTTFSRHKLKFMFGFSQDKGRILQNFNASSFLTKFTTLESFIGNIIILMENASESERIQWKAKFNKYIVDTVFNVDSFLSARAVMIIGIIGQRGISESLCKSLLQQTIKIIGEPYINDELLFFIISHAFTYSKVVEGLDPNSKLLRHLFWLSATFAQSPNTIFYHGGLLFMANALKRIHLGERSSTQPLRTCLFESREFAESPLSQLEAMSSLKWTENNFAHIIINLISKGLLVPYIKATAVDCLKLFFTISFRDRGQFPNEDHWSFLLFLYLIMRPAKLKLLLEEVQMTDKLVYLDEQNFVTEGLLNWMDSDSDNSIIALYQASVYFASGVSDELSKIRYLLLIGHLAKVRPVKLFRVYQVIRTELRRISALDVQSEFPQLVFSIAQTVVLHKGYFQEEYYMAKTDKLIDERGLRGIKSIEFPSASSDVMSGVRSNPYAIYERKKLTVMIMARMTHSI